MLKLNAQVRSLVGPSRWAVPLHRSRHALVGALVLVIIGVIAIGAFATSIPPQSVQINGYAGYLGEWELTATLSRNAPGTVHDLSGPMRMKHVGMCSKDGPEEKTGEMQLRLSRLSSNVDVRLMFDGIECTHRGNMSDAYIGTMVCPDRRAVPLTLWIK